MPRRTPSVLCRSTLTTGVPSWIDQPCSHSLLRSINWNKILNNSTANWSGYATIDTLPLRLHYVTKTTRCEINLICWIVDGVIVWLSFVKIARLCQQHKLELQTIVNELSANTTETRVSDLLRKLESQDATIADLKVIRNSDCSFD